MRRLVLVCVLLMLALNMTVLAQDNVNGQWAVGFNGSGGIPTGDFKNLSDFGFGGSGWVGYMVDPYFTLTGKVGYLRFSGKDYNLSIQGTAVAASTTYSIVPITVGGRYFFSQGDSHVYGSAEAGLYLLNTNIDIKATGNNAYFSGSGSSSESKFGVAPTLGIQFKAGDNMNVDVHGNYTAVFTSGSTLSWIGFGVGLEFALK